MNYYELVLLDATKSYDNKYTYRSPLPIEIGSRVLVPFGVSNRNEEAIIVKSVIKPDSDYVVKDIKKVISGKMTKMSLELINHLCDYYVLNPASVMRLYFQSFKRKDIKRKKKNYYKFNMRKEELLQYLTTLRSNSKQIPDFILSNLDNKKAFKKPTNMTSKNFEKLIDDGVLVLSQTSSINGSLSRLTNSQNLVFKDIYTSEDRVHMIVGVNASGKTEIFFHLINKTSSGIKLILVPELFQIPQLEKRAKELFSGRIGIIHSKMSDAKRIEVEKKVLDGEIDIIIGTPIALFLNVDYSLIILDECHEDSYRLKSPSLDVRMACIMLSNISGAKVVFLSATPSIEHYFDPSIIKHILPNRFVKDISNTVKIVDMREELINGNKSYISRELDFNIKRTLNKKKQVLILMNKKGKHSFVSCRECGFVYKCDKCDLPYLHMGSNRLECKLCSNSIKIGDKCPKCHSKYIKYFGGGIMKLEDEVKELYPGAKIVRIESKIFSNENSLHRVYSDINSGKYDIIIGTHIIAKALDIKNVELCAAIMIDSIINISEYRAYEKAYQIISQLSGRASRFSDGMTIVQTYNPDSYIFNHLLKNDFIGFADEELSIRMETKYPPFTDHLIIRVYLEDSDISKFSYIIDDLKGKGIKISEIYQPVYSKLNNKNVYQILFSDSENINYVKDYFLNFMKHNRDFKYKIEVDPLYLMY